MFRQYPVIGVRGLTDVLVPDYPIQTRRLLLRPFTMEDGAMLLDILSRSDVVRYLYIGEQSAEQIAQSLTRRLGQTAIRAPGDSLHLAVEVKGSPQLIGDVSLQWLLSEHRQGEIGFIFHPDYHGHGYATEAAREMLRLGFENLGLHRICGRLEARNRPSGRVLERLGMRLEAHLRENEWVKDEWNDELIYAILTAEWRGLAQTGH